MSMMARAFVWYPHAMSRRPPIIQTIKPSCWAPMLPIWRTPEPADDAEAGAGIFKKSIEGYRDHGARSRLFSERGNRMCALPVPQKVLSQINVSYPACALTLVGNFSL